MDKKSWAVILATVMFVGCTFPCLADEIPSTGGTYPDYFNYETQSPEEILESSEWLQNALSIVNIEGIDTSKFAINLDNTSQQVLTKQYAQICEEFKQKGFGESYVVESPQAVQSGKNAQELFKQTYGNLFEESTLKKAEIPSDFDTKATISSFLNERENAYEKVINAPDSLFKKVANQISIGTSSYNAALNTNTVSIWSEDRLRAELDVLNATTDSNIQEKYKQFINEMPNKVSTSLQALVSEGGTNLTASTKSSYDDAVNKMFVSLSVNQATNDTVVDSINSFVMLDEEGKEIPDTLKNKIINEAKAAEKAQNYTTNDVYTAARNYVKTEEGLYARVYGTSSPTSENKRILNQSAAILEYSGLTNDEITKKILNKYNVTIDPISTFHNISNNKTAETQKKIEEEKKDKQGATEITDNSEGIDYQIKTLKIYNSAIYEAIITAGGKPGTSMSSDDLRQYITIAGYNITAASYVKMKYNYFQALCNAGYLDADGNATDKINELEGDYLLYPDFNILQSSGLATGYTREQENFIYNATIATCNMGNPYY